MRWVDEGLVSGRNVKQAASGQLSDLLNRTGTQGGVPSISNRGVATVNSVQLGQLEGDQVSQALSMIHSVLNFLPVLPINCCPVYEVRGVWVLMDGQSGC